MVETASKGTMTTGGRPSVRAGLRKVASAAKSRLSSAKKRAATKIRNAAEQVSLAIRHPVRYARIRNMRVTKDGRKAEASRRAIAASVRKGRLTAPQTDRLRALAARSHDRVEERRKPTLANALRSMVPAGVSRYVSLSAKQASMRRSQQRRKSAARDLTAAYRKKYM